MPVLFGMQTVTGTILPDMENFTGEPHLRKSKLLMFFVFTDLSVRIHGEFRLAVHLIDLKGYLEGLTLGTTYDYDMIGSCILIELLALTKMPTQSSIPPPLLYIPPKSFRG